MFLILDSALRVVREQNYRVRNGSPWSTRSSWGGRGGEIRIFSLICFDPYSET